MIAVLVVAATLHVVVSALVATYLSHAHSHRIVNLRAWKNTGSAWENTGSTWEALASTFARHAQRVAATSGQRSLVVIGSSVSYGFPFGPEAAFSQSLIDRLPGYHVANLSAVGMGVDGISDFLGCYFGPAFRPDVLVIEIPMVNTTAALSPTSDLRRRECVHPRAVYWGLWGLAITRPLGAGWVSMLWEETVANDPSAAIQISQIADNFFAASDRFARIEPKYRQLVTRYLDDVAGMGQQVLVFVSPVHLPAVVEAGGDAQAVAHQIRLTNELCLGHGRVHCLDVEPFAQRRDFFYNMTHFNPRGSRAFGDWVAEQVTKLQQQ